jgi:hypothetical protein
MVRIAIETLTQGGKVDRKLAERLMTLSSAAYRLAVCALGTEEGAEDVVLRAYRNALAQARSSSAVRDERILLFRAVINAARARMNVKFTRRPAEPPRRSTRPRNRIQRNLVSADRN